MNESRTQLPHPTPLARACFFHLEDLWPVAVCCVWLWVLKETRETDALGEVNLQHLLCRESIFHLWKKGPEASEEGPRLSLEVVEG